MGHYLLTDTTCDLVYEMTEMSLRHFIKDELGEDDVTLSIEDIAEIVSGQGYTLERSI